MLLCFLGLAHLAGWSGLAFQAKATPPALSVFSTRQTEIFYQTPGDLDTLGRRLGISQGSPLDKSALQRLADKIDGMLGEIQRVLKASPLKPVTLTIRLLRDSVQVQQQHQQKVRALPRFRQRLTSPSPLLSFYDPAARTIYVSLADIHIGILAHEMTHFVLCEAFPTRPGVAYQESLAQYMEKRFMTGKPVP